MSTQNQAGIAGVQLPGLQFQDGTPDGARDGVGDPTPDLQIIGAVYGLAKVTSQVIGLVDRTTTPQSLSIVPSNQLFGDSWPNYHKSFTVAYRYGDTGAVQVSVVAEGSPLTIGASEFEASRLAKNARTDVPQLSVLAATYGLANVTGQVSGMVNAAQQSLTLTPDNATFGDSWPFRRKTFVIVAAYDDLPPFMDIVVEGNPYFLKYRPALHVMGAYWGTTDVSAVVQGLVSRRTLALQASDAVLGATLPAGWAHSLMVAYQYENSAPQCAVVAQGATMAIDYVPNPGYEPPEDPRTLNVIAASYGPADVTATVRGLLQSNTLNFTAGNAVFGDTWPYTRKTFALTYSWGPGAPITVAVEEAQPVQVSAPAPQVSPPVLMSLAGLFGDGDEVMFQASNGGFWTVDGTTGQILAPGGTPAAGTPFTVHLPTADAGHITLAAPGGTPVVVGADGTLHVAAGTAAVFLVSLTSNGTVALSVVGPGLTFAALGAGGAITASGSNSLSFGTTFSFMMNATEQGLRSHILANGLDEEAEISFALAKVIWDLTGGWFAALGLGPLMRGESAMSGVAAMLGQNARVDAAVKAVVDAVKANPQASIAAGALVVLQVIVAEGFTWKLLRQVLDVGWYALPFVAGKVLAYLTPAAYLAAAETVFEFTMWAYDTATDIQAYLNSGAENAVAALAPPAGALA